MTSDIFNTCGHRSAGYNAFGWGCSECGISASFPTVKIDGRYWPRDPPDGGTIVSSADRGRLSVGSAPGPAAFPAVSFTVYGQPQPAGSKRGFYNKKAGRVVITDANERSRPWKALVADAAAEAVNGDLLDGPLSVVFTFYVPRPKGHFGKKGLLPSAPAAPTVKPDLLKLARAIEDAMSGVVYRDDSQIVAEWLIKQYGEPARCEITVDRLIV